MPRKADEFIYRSHLAQIKTKKQQHLQSGELLGAYDRVGTRTYAGTCVRELRSGIKCTFDLGGNRKL